MSVDPDGKVPYAVHQTLKHFNKLRGYVDFGGRGATLPLSYTAIERTFYSLFLFQGMLTTPVGFPADIGENPRELEIEQLRRLMNLVAERVLDNRYDLKIGAFQIESRVAKGEAIGLEHLRAFRLTREEILGTWLRRVREYIHTYVVMQGLPVDTSRLMQTRLPEPLWDANGRLQSLSASVSRSPASTRLIATWQNAWKDAS